MAVFGRAWNGRHRVGFDVSKPGAKSALYQGTNSQWNEAEVQRICELVVLFMEYRPADDRSREITPDDIVVLTPYTGQRLAILAALYNMGKPYATKIAVHSTLRYQGQEKNVTLISMVKNVPGNALKLGFVKDPHQLNVSSQFQD